MSEGDAVAASGTPRTRASLGKDLQAIGVQAGTVLMVHCSLSAMGWVSGGAVTVLEALLDVLGPEGTLVMPAHSNQLTDPANWVDPPAPVEWHPAIRDTLPAYDLLRTPTRGMGCVAELFRTWPGARRSAHPAYSVAALGRAAEQITALHPLDCPMGEASPLRTLYDLAAQILLIGVGYDTCTILHLAEHRALPEMPVAPEGAPMLKDGLRHWITYRMPEHDSDRFPALCAVLDSAPGTRLAKVGNAAARLLSAREAVERAVEGLKSGQGKSSFPLNEKESS